MCSSGSADHAVHITTRRFSAAAESDISGQSWGWGEGGGQGNIAMHTEGNATEHFQPIMWTSYCFLEPGFLLSLCHLSSVQFASFTDIT